MNYTAPEWILIIGAIGVLLNGVITSWRNTGKINTVLDNTSATLAKADATLISAKVTEGHVNSKETKLTEQLIAANDQINLLKEVIAEKDKTKALLAQAVVQTSVQSKPSSELNKSGEGVAVQLEGVIKT